MPQLLRLYPLKHCPKLVCRRSRLCHASYHDAQCLRLFMTARERGAEVKQAVEAILERRCAGASRSVRARELQESWVDFMKIIDDRIDRRMRTGLKGSSYREP